MPEIGECYSISEKIPKLGLIESITISPKAKIHIIKHNQNFNKLINCEIDKPFAYGKSIMFPLVFKDGSLGILCSQLGMTGSWFINEAFKERGSDHIILKSKNTILRYSDPRMFGKMKIYTGDSYLSILENIKVEHKWGIDPIISSVEDIYDKLIKLKKSKVGIKAKLLEQNLIFGIGNYLASEVLFYSKISPHNLCSDLTEDQFSNLSNNIKKVCLLAKSKKGFSFAGGYILPDGSYGNMKDFILIYGKDKCPNCQSKITQDYIKGRVSFWCKKCQK